MTGSSGERNIPRPIGGASVFGAFIIGCYYSRPYDVFLIEIHYFLKYRIYIDEVGNSDLKSSTNEQHRFLSLTGIIIDLEYVRTTLQPALEALKEKYFESHPDNPIILHRKELIYKKPPFHSLADPELAQRFDDELLFLLEKWEYSVISVIIDKEEHNHTYARSWKYDPYHYCQEIILERYNLFLKIKKAVGDVMIESRGSKEDMRLKDSFRGLMESGTSYLEADELGKRITSKELKVKQKSANIAGLQLADLIAHAARRFSFKRFWEMDDGKITFSDSIIELLQKKKFFSYKGNIIGYGCKKLP